MRTSRMQELAVGQIRISDKFKLKQLQMKNDDTYLFVHVFSSINSNECGDTFDILGSLCVIKELRLHGRVVFDMGWVVQSAAESMRTGCKGRLTIGFSKNIL